VVFFILSANMFPVVALAAPPEITADAAVLIDAKTGEIYYSKNAEKRMNPASLTKIMTGILAIELGGPRDVVEAGRGPHNVTTGSTMGLCQGDKLTLDDLTKAALMMSANDATVAIAEHICEDHGSFTEQMNLKAFTLGALNTKFRNTNGYTSPNHYSTAYDLALITRYALKNNRFAEIVKSKEATVKWKNRKKELTFANTNRMLRDERYYYPGIDGVKTGTTTRAGHCLAASATRNNRQLIAIVLHCNNRYKDAAALLDYGFNEHLPRKIVNAGSGIGTVGVLNGIADNVPVVVKEDIEAVLSEDDMEHLEIYRHVLKNTPAPIDQGEVLGRLIITCRGRVVNDVDLIAQKNVLTDNFINRLKVRFLAEKS